MSEDTFHEDKLPSQDRIEKIFIELFNVWLPNLPPCPAAKLPNNPNDAKRLGQENCKSCPKLTDPTPSGLASCIRDVAHLAATYEARNEITKGVVGKKKSVSNSLKCLRLRLKKNESKKALKTRRTYIEHSVQFTRLGWLKNRFTGGHVRAENRELAKFIFSIERLFPQKHDQFYLVIETIRILEGREISEDAIIKTCTRYRNLKK